MCSQSTIDRVDITCQLLVVVYHLRIIIAAKSFGGRKLTTPGDGKAGKGMGGHDCSLIC